MKKEKANFGWNNAIQDMTISKLIGDADKYENEKVFHITESQLKSMLEKVCGNIHKIADKKGECALSLSISGSVTDTINDFMKKNC